MTWKSGIKDAVDVIDDFITEYKALYDNQQYMIQQGRGSTKLAIDYSVTISALKRVIDALKELQSPESVEIQP